MIVGVLRVAFSIPGSTSLKDKRRLVQSLLTRLHQLRVAAAEVGAQDNMRRAELAVACVSTGVRHVHQILSRALALAQRETEMVLIDHEMEVR